MAEALSVVVVDHTVRPGVLREHGALPPVLPIVIYNGRGPWTAPTDVADLLAATEAALAPYQPSQRYFLLDEARTRPAELPPGNLVSALVALETTRDRQEIERHLRTLIDLLAGQDDDELRRAFSAWTRQALMPAPFRATETEPLAQLEEVRTMLAETVREWTKDWVAQGREEGREEGSPDPPWRRRLPRSPSTPPGSARRTAPVSRPRGVAAGSSESRSVKPARRRTPPGCGPPC